MASQWVLLLLLLLWRYVSKHSFVDAVRRPSGDNAAGTVVFHARGLPRSTDGRVSRSILAVGRMEEGVILGRNDVAAVAVAAVVVHVDPNE
jgi:hypothetical protein